MDMENIKAQSVENAEEVAETPVTPVPTETPTETPAETPEGTSEGAPEETPEETPAENPDTQSETPPPATPKKKKFFKKWWFWAIVAVVLVSAIAIIGVVASDSGSSSSGGSYYVPVESPYVRMVKGATNSSYGITYGAAFENFFSDTSWDYFTSTDGQHVVEFEGDFYYDGSPATATVQFVLNISEGTFTVYHLSINDVSQSRFMLSALIQKVFESY